MAVAIGLIFGVSPSHLASYTAGLLIFGTSALTICWIASRMLLGASTPTPGSIGWSMVGLGVKALVLGGGTYLALVVGSLGVWGFFAGAVSALVFVVSAVRFVRL